MQRLIHGWGCFPRQPCHVVRPETLAALQQAIVEGGQRDYIARGLGRSYGDAALNAGRGVLLQTRRDYFVRFDESTGILECEAGVSLQQIIDVCLPRGWFLPVTPGTKFVTVGGAIAADVHGKNSHRDGAFGEYVLGLRLCLANGDVVDCSTQDNPRLFAATVGGMGLTGVIVSARLQLMPVEAAHYHVHVRRTRCLDETLDALRATDSQFRYSVAWVDALSSGGTMGRAVLLLSNDASRDDLPRSLRDRPLASSRRIPGNMLFTLPSLTLNWGTIKAFNAFYYARHREGARWLDYDRFFYPLDGMSHWNRVYGRRGFVQYQALVPTESAREGLQAVLECVARSKHLVTLAVLKSTRVSATGLLSYLLPGHTLAMDLPYTGERVERLCRELDQILLRHGGRL